ncbi:MAG TPA: glycoside hydrolase family 2 TIM barrel-domain containing protein, partial [Candidatus Limnocylindria bacterium]|nr:glycoside hydrolase family 2 TIM barrel-domain containing protein [Candidatus Limnocylindria bacterium]
ETLGNHPSLVIWTIINEDWGTRLRYEKRDREWLKHTYRWMKRLDPTRLVVDNSACETTETPNFHLETDLADFHVYFGPDNFVRWQHMVRDYARRPAWLWSPHGDAEPRGDEPLVLSEFGGWGLPRLDGMLDHYGSEPWWFGTGHGYYRPSGLRRRFARYGLDRLWTDIDHLATATQWGQFHSLHLQIAEMRQQRSIAGYVVTELSDAYWEANGMLDVARRPKAYHARLGEINAPDVVMFLPEHHDLWGGDWLAGELFVSSYAAEPAPEVRRGRVDWRLQCGGAAREGSFELARWPRHDVAALGRVELPVPEVDGPTDACLELRAYDGSGRLRARNELPLAVLPRGGVEGRPALAVSVHDPLDIWGIAERMRQLGHRLTSRADAEIVVAGQLTGDLVSYAERGGRVLVLVRSSSAVPPELELRRRITPHLRRLPHAGWPGQRSPWEGDWVSNFNWILPGSFPELPDRAPLDVAYRQVAPDHVLLGYDPVRHREEVSAGMFVGWVHEPAALLWSFTQGAGLITLTTFRLAPESGPVASAMLQCLLEQLAAGRPVAAPSAAARAR